MRVATSLFFACFLAGCTVTPAPAPQPSGSSAPVVALQAATVVTGVVRAPKTIRGVLPTGGGHVVPTGGGRVLPTGGGHVVPTGGGRLLAVSEEPLANTKVYLADAAGQPYPLIEPVTTDEAGRFTFANVPVGVTLVVLAIGRDTTNGKEAELQSLVRTSPLGASTTVDTASSLVTLAVVEGQPGELGEFNASAFRTASEATAKRLSDAAPPDLTDRASLVSLIGKLTDEVAELKTAIAAIRQDLQDIKATLEEIKTKLGQPQPRPHPPIGPNGGAGICSAPTDHEFVLSGTYAAGLYPLTLQVIAPHGAVLRTLQISKPGEAVPFNFVEICPNQYTLADKDGKPLADVPAFVIQKGAPKRVTLPF